MTTASPAFTLKGIIAASALIFTVAAVAQPVQPNQPSAVSDTAPGPTSSNPMESLPAMSADRCAAEAIGTASDPKTGAPVRVSVDPQTGKPLCPTIQPKTEAKPPR